MYQDAVSEFSLENKVLLLVTDSASNMLKAFRPSFALYTLDDSDPEKSEVDDEVGHWQFACRVTYNNSV